MLPCHYAPRLHRARVFSQRKSSRFASVVVQTVFQGPPGFSTQAKESSSALQEHLIQTQVYCYSILLLQQMMMKRGELPCLSSSVGDQLQETSLYFTSSFRKLSYSFSLKLLLLLQWHLSNLFYSHLFCAAPVFYF